MALEVLIKIEAVVQIEHDGPTEGLDKTKYDALLAGALVHSKETLRLQLSEALHTIGFDDRALGWIDDNVCYFAGDIPAAAVIEVKKAGK
jgi:hypothetical protein